MKKYRGMTHYHFKPGMELKGIQFLERELFKKAREQGCHEIELLQLHTDGSYYIATGLWYSLEEARAFHEVIRGKEEELAKFCTRAPERQIYLIEAVFRDRKAA